MSPEEEIVRAGEARQVLESRIWKEATQNLDDQLAFLRQRVAISDGDMHTRIILLEQMYGWLKTYFEQIATTGRMAEVQLEERRRSQSLIDRGVAMFRAMGRNF